MHLHLSGPAKQSPTTKFSIWQIIFQHNTYFPLRRQTAIYIWPCHTVLRVRFVDPSRPPPMRLSYLLPGRSGDLLSKPWTCQIKIQPCASTSTGRIHSSLCLYSLPFRSLAGCMHLLARPAPPLCLLVTQNQPFLSNQTRPSPNYRLSPCDQTTQCIISRTANQPQITNRRKTPQSKPKLTRY